MVGEADLAGTGVRAEIAENGTPGTLVRWAKWRRLLRRNRRRGRRAAGAERSGRHAHVQRRLLRSANTMNAQQCCADNGSGGTMMLEGMLALYE